MMRKIIFATHNPHKLQEARAIVGSDIEIVGLSDIGCNEELPETQDTLEGNALQKARYVKEHYGYNCFADDTGLEVMALGGAPGVMTARYAGAHCSPEDNIRKLLAMLEGESDRRARFVTVVAYVTDESEHTFEGSVEGNISTELRGVAGFGYDPVFIPMGREVAFAEMSEAEKNQISHRGRAMRRFTDYLDANS